MLPDRVSNPGPLTYESGALPIALRGPASCRVLNSIFPGGNRIANLSSELKAIRENLPITYLL